MLLSERRKQYRRMLEGNVCVHPASVFDAMSARMAQSLGFEAGVFAGSIGSGAAPGAAGVIFLALAGFSWQIPPHSRGGGFSPLVGRCPGVGNAVKVNR